MYCGGGIPPASQMSVAVCFSTAHGDAQTILGGVIVSRVDYQSSFRSADTVLLTSNDYLNGIIFRFSCFKDIGLTPEEIVISKRHTMYLQAIVASFVIRRDKSVLVSSFEPRDFSSRIGQHSTFD